jgi:hypothetical protein
MDPNEGTTVTRTASQEEVDSGDERSRRELTTASIADMWNLMTQIPWLNHRSSNDVHVQVSARYITVFSRRRRVPRLEPEDDVLCRVNAMADVVADDFERGQLRSQSFLGSIRPHGSAEPIEGAVCMMWRPVETGRLHADVESESDSSPPHKVQRR